MTFKNFLKRINALLHDNRMEIARCLLPDIVAYFEQEQGQREFAEWKAQQEAEKKEKSEVA